MTVIDKERLARLARALDNRAKALVKTEEDRAMIAEAVLDGKINNKQDKTDNTLNTEDKTIVGAINELESEVFDIAANVISMDAYKADKTYVDEQLSNITNNGITEAELDLLLEEIFGINSKNELTSVRLGNYQMKYDNVNDTLDFLYNGVIGEPMEEIIPLTWVVGNLSGTDGSETEQTSTLRSGFVTIEDNYDYSFYLGTSMADPGGIRVYFYDSNKTYISRTDGDIIGYITGSYNSIVVPTNAAYMRFKSNVNGTTTINNINSLFTLRKRKTKVNNYVTEGLSMYIDANDVATYGSVRDITGKQNITNHGVSTTLDNGYLNFVANESDYIDCGFKPNLTKWSLEYNFYLTELPDTSITMIGWGASGNRVAIGIWGDTYMIAINDDTYNRICTKPLLLSLVQVILTYDNGSIIAYVNGEKSQIATNANVMTSQAGNLMIGTKYDASSDFTDMHLKSLRFYDGKVLSDEEALQNYNYELNRNGNILSVTWNNNQYVGTDGYLYNDETSMTSNFISVDSKYNYTIYYTANVSEIRIVCYDSSQTLISRSDYITSGAVDTLMTFPENTGLIRIKATRGSITVNEANANIIIKKVLK